MDHRSDDVELVRSVGCSLADEDTSEKSVVPTNDDKGGGGSSGAISNSGGLGDLSVPTDNLADDDADLPQCKIKRNYSCNLCPFFSQNPRSFLYHSRDVHFDRIKIFECSQCLYASKHSQKLQRHINMIHVAGKNKMKRAAKVAKTEKKKEPRAIKPKPPDPEEDGTKQDECDPSILENILKTEPGKEDETTVEAVDGEFKCSVCNFRNKNQKLMRRHEKIVHLKKRFLRCSKCSYVTHVKARYTKHVKYHSMPMIKCNLCDFRTPYKWNLDRHYKNHSGSGAFLCSKCNFRADIKQSLTVHEMNHHVPPVGQGAIMARKKNKVGASETLSLEPEAIDRDELELLRLEREDAEAAINPEENIKEEDDDDEETGNFQKIRNVKLPYNNKRESANNNHLQTDFIHPDDIVPRYGQIYVKNLKCKFCSYKAVFSHEIWRHEKRIHGYIRPENKKENVAKRPPPKLIPIQNKGQAGSPVSSPILKIPAVRNKTPLPTRDTSPVEKAVNEKEFNEMCKKSCLTSSLKDFVSLIGDEEGLKTIPDSSMEEDLEEEAEGTVAKMEDGEEKGCGSATKQKQTDLLKRKNASFFDKLKEKLMTGSSEEVASLFCETCGHESKCLSEAVAHQKRHSSAGYKADHQENDVVLSGAELSSTRCQHCRQRCKTSTDLINHLKSCKAFCASQSGPDETVKVKVETFNENDEEEKTEEEEEGKPMENRVFVWNDLRAVREEDEEDMDVDVAPGNEDFPIDMAAGYGTVTSKGSDNTESGTLVMEIDPRLSLTVKKVFKCPHCSFWASTASRFHVHIVGHLNKKPFECSLCLYRSNWRWDITKHIRLKSARDPSHLEAQVNMTDETGRRNYSKYNKYLTMMKVQEPTAESSGTGRRSKPSEATQGNVTERDIIPLPAPPRLTRAPTPGISHQVPQGLPLRPPPPLKAAHHLPSQVKAQSGLMKCFKDTTKKTLWKCKKCNFRDSNKVNVLTHVKEHYGKKHENLFNSDSSASLEDVIGTSVEVPIESQVSPESQEVSSKDGSNTPKTLKLPSYRCGHCNQLSNWKHVIQRHCRLKHNGDARILVEWRDAKSIQPSGPEENLEMLEPQEDSVELFSCDICPFTTDTEGDLTAHKLNHVDRPGSIFKCSYCPFYVPSKIAVLEHMEIHGVSERCELISLKVDNFDPSECNEEFTAQSGGNSKITSKRFKCRQCPYLSNSRTQFLYHKQFHRPRGAPFKCMYCSYNVSRRHLLHQHLRVHHNQRDGSKVADQVQELMETVPMSEVDTLDMPEIPQVWVLKSGAFHKMFKCRWCPHVNVRKINIQEHEKMHRPHEGKKKNSDAVIAPLKLRCPDCNYTCNNAGVLASHIKVHQGFYGNIRCLVDPTKSDAEQLEELKKGLAVMEPDVVIKVEPESLFEEEVPAKEIKEEPISSQPENAYSHASSQEENVEENGEIKKVLSFCDKCPARFFLKKELRIHSKFHLIQLPFRCSYCTYTARQRPHLLAHYKVHGQEYQDKTAGLLDCYSVSPDSPKPETVVVAKESDVIDGPVWMVMLENLVRSKEKKIKTEGQSRVGAKHRCHRCPATFFKSVALQYHLTLHGGSHQHKCKYCDYTVKTYGNLIKHQLVHEEDSKKAPKGFRVTVPISGTELFQHKEEIQMQDEAEKSSESFSDEMWKKKTDPQFGTLMHGSPEFIYPTYFKNGKIKEKRYKCHKCPSAFEKRDQYRIHLSLHGSKQKYKCEKCDYSVKYYANYIQHMRKHQNHDEALKARNSEAKIVPEEAATSSPAHVPELPPVRQEVKPPLFELTLLEQQTLLLQRIKKQIEGKDEDKKTYCCAYCPYASIRRDAVDNHIRRHYHVSGMKSGFECTHCDYSATQGNFLRDHNRLHFSGSCRHRAEAYLKCEKMELWCWEEKTKDDARSPESKVLIFQDRGDDAEERFFPPVEKPDSEKEETKWRMYVNPETGEPVGDTTEEESFAAFDGESNENEESPRGFELRQEDLIEMVEEQEEELEKPKPKTKRWRGKNWKCKKCPHAFGKRDQYLRHVALHGSNQRHNCDICDYSVKFYTNYVQHMRMHQTHEPDKVILVKKNFQSADEIPGKATKVSESPTEDIELSIKKTGDGIPDDESDSLLSQEEKPAPEKEDESDREYSSLTEGTEVSEDEGTSVEHVSRLDAANGEAENVPLVV